MKTETPVRPFGVSGPAADAFQAFFDMVDFCLHRLPPGTARVFMMRELFEMEAREICRELSITQNNLGVLMYRARMALRQCLEAHWFLHASEAE